MKPLGRFLLLLLCASIGVATELKTATTHPIQYYLSLPDQWTSGKAWPVVFVIESANRDFETAAEVYRKARGARPFILVTPLVVTNGGARYREVPSYHYSDSTWAQIAKDGACRFDTDGLRAIAADLHKLYQGEEQYFITGLEAAGHTVWMQVFTSPELLRAAAPVAPNYQGRCVEEIGWSTSPSRATLPVKVFGGSQDQYWSPGKPFRAQTDEAERAATQHGYKNISESVVQGKGHEALAEEVLTYFASLVKNR